VRARRPDPQRLLVVRLDGRLGYDGIAFDERHTSPCGLMSSPNLLASATSPRTQRIKIVI
jgi:alkanesulfonate monooxygenase SsuD/methylene tetrahydromethanopterin reductase-like flavin-dependent oxidoreductase (luciferase family)